MQCQEKVGPVVVFPRVMKECRNTAVWKLALTEGEIVLCTRHVHAWDTDDLTRLPLAGEKEPRN